MNETKYFLLGIVLLLTGSLLAVEGGGDEGYFFVAPREVQRTKELKKGVQIVAYFQRGVFVTEKKDSPWYQAALFIQGTAIKNAEGKILQDVALCEATDADGDLNWSILWRPNGKTGTISFKLGTGKWEGIEG
ncbi:MAG: hypothetical protein MI892_23280, partial [Desulfobacterales bacterium]|nr:hypothetical protein [Desulfobacterales bacterium]